jgi:hydrogenase-4 component B
MVLALLLGAGAVHAVCGALAPLVARAPRAARLVGAGVALASAVGAGAAAWALAAGVDPAPLALTWPLPIGEVAVGVDALSASFLLAVHVVTALAAMSGAAAPLVAAAAALVFLARDGVLLLVGWEVVSLAGGFRGDRRLAGLAIAQLGTVPLLLGFALLAGRSGDYAFTSFAAALPERGLAGTGFVLAVVGFGAGAVFWLVHAWRARGRAAAAIAAVATPAAIYGGLRVVGFLGGPPSWPVAALAGGLLAAAALLVAALVSRAPAVRLAWRDRRAPPLPYRAPATVAVVAAAAALAWILGGTPPPAAGAAIASWSGLLLLALALADLYLLAASGPAACAGALVIQGVALAALPLALALGPPGARTVATAAGALALNAAILPWLALRALGAGGAPLPAEPVGRKAIRVLVGSLLVALWFYLARGLVAAGLSAVALGLLVLASRRGAAVRVVGTAMLVNGAFPFAVALGRGELALLLDVLAVLSLWGIALRRAETSTS